LAPEKEDLLRRPHAHAARPGSSWNPGPLPEPTWALSDIGCGSQLILSAYAPSHSILSSRTTFSAIRKSLFLNEFFLKFAFKIVAKSLIPLIFLSKVD
jgi:hypothetical protein